MKKYIAFAKVILKQQFKKLSDVFGTLLSFTIHISIFSLLWDFVLEGKTMAGYSQPQLVWYLILAEAIIYSYSNLYKKIAAKIEMGDFAYDLTKPYNFMLRINEKLLDRAKDLGIEYLVATAHPENVASNKSLGKLGMECKGQFMRYGKYLRNYLVMKIDS